HLIEVAVTVADPLPTAPTTPGARFVASHPGQSPVDQVVRDALGVQHGTQDADDLPLTLHDFGVRGHRRIRPSRTDGLCLSLSAPALEAPRRDSPGQWLT